MHSVTSNAVANMNSVKIQVNYSGEVRDIFALIDSAINERVTFIEVCGDHISNAPDGTDANHFNYTIQKHSADWITVIACDVRSKNIYKTSKLSGVWQSWSFLSVENQTLSCTVIYSGTTYKAVRNGNVVMVYVHNDSVPVSANYRTDLLRGLPAPANGIFPTGIIDWGGIATNANVEVSDTGVIRVVGTYNTPQYPSTVNITVDSVVTYICQ